MAIDAGHGAMRSNEDVIGRCVIKTSDVAPHLGGVAGLASERFSVPVGLRHPLAKLTTVRIEMAVRAGQIIKMVGDGQGCPRESSGLVTVGTRYGEMSPRQGESCLFVPGQGECRGEESFDGMAAFALIAIWPPRELPSVNILVTIRASGRLDLV